MITSSGTAVANLLPAVVEAAQAAVPLLLVTADRPGELRDCGANQTIDQAQCLRSAGSTHIYILYKTSNKPHVGATVSALGLEWCNAFQVSSQMFIPQLTLVCLLFSCPLIKA